MTADPSTNTPAVGTRPLSAVPAVPRRMGLALVVISLAQLMLVLDELIVNTALPHIQQALHFSGTGLEWVVTGYAVTFGGLLMLGGRAGDILGRRRMLSAGILAFSLASLLGGLATTSWLLITARVLQGACAAVAALVAGISDEHAGIASSMFNAGQQVGGAVGLAVIGSVAWTIVNNHVRHSLTHVSARSAVLPGHPGYADALTAGVHSALTIGAVATVLALLVTLVAIRVRRDKLPDSPPA